MENPFRDADIGAVRLIETMLWQPRVGVALVRRHRDRMCLSARRLGFGFSTAEFDTLLAAVAGEAPLRLRLTLGCDGDLQLEQAPVPAPKSTWRVALAPEHVRRDDPWLGVKSTRRALYDTTRRDLPEGLDEALFLNEAGTLAEGTIFNVIVERADGLVVTPPLSDGALPGVMRAELLATGECQVASLPEEELFSARNIWLCNALRGKVHVSDLVSWPA